MDEERKNEDKTGFLTGIKPKEDSVSPRKTSTPIHLSEDRTHQIENKFSRTAFRSVGAGDSKHGGPPQRIPGYSKPNPTATNNNLMTSTLTNTYTPENPLLPRTRERRGAMVILATVPPPLSSLQERKIVVTFQSLLENPLSSIFTKYIAYLQDTKTEELLKFYNACQDYRYHTPENERDVKIAKIMATYLTTNSTWSVNEYLPAYVLYSINNNYQSKEPTLFEAAKQVIVDVMERKSIPLYFEAIENRIFYATPEKRLYRTAVQPAPLNWLVENSKCPEIPLYNSPARMNYPMKNEMELRLGTGVLKLNASKISALLKKFFQPYPIGIKVTAKEEKGVMTYTWIASEGIDWILKNQNDIKDREGAVQILRDWFNEGHFVHIGGLKTFIDGHIVYKNKKKID